MIIAVDGPAASGKGTLSERLAAHYGIAHLDTGRTYRAVAWAMHQRGLGYDDEAAAVATAREVDFGRLDDPNLATHEAGEGASRIAVMPALRKVLVERQRVFALSSPQGAVVDGRDIGTVVFPDAAVKLFITASAEVRARRRSLQLFGTDSGPDYERLLAALRERDARDSGRAASPLRPADDATILDTSGLDIDEALAVAVGLVDKAANA